MGGPMGVHDDERYPYLAEEKTVIKKAVESGKIVMGICLGAQLIAHVLGAGVSKNTHREIGWFPITLFPEARTTLISPCFPERFEVFHWHGDRFEIPPGAVHLACSDACYNQGFVIGNTVFGFQFHLETTLESAMALIENCGNELDGSTFVQSKETIVSDPERFRRINTVMHDVLSRIEGVASSP
jgi:GMP synthase-like glutamine amidotransferase